MPNYLIAIVDLRLSSVLFSAISDTFCRRISDAPTCQLSQRNKT